MLAIVERPAPTVGPRDVRIAVRAASLNPLFAELERGHARGKIIEIIVTI